MYIYMYIYIYILLYSFMSVLVTILEGRWDLSGGTMLTLTKHEKTTRNCV